MHDMLHGLLKVWQSPKCKRVVTHWASMLRWIRSISEYNLKTRDSPKRTLKSRVFVWERRGSGPEKQKAKHNPCRPVGRNWKEPIFIGSWFKLKTWPQWWEKTGTWTQGVWQRSIYRMESKGYRNTINGKYEVVYGIVHHKSRPQNMCLTHSWPQQKVQFQSSHHRHFTTLHRSYTLVTMVRGTQPHPPKKVVMCATSHVCAFGQNHWKLFTHHFWPLPLQSLLRQFQIIYTHTFPSSSNLRGQNWLCTIFF